MLDWIKDNHELVSVSINLAMLLVWFVYLQLFLVSHWRQTRPNILINIEGNHGSTDARCLISNMSSDAIYVLSLIATLQTEKGQWSCTVTEVERPCDQESAHGDLPGHRPGTRQGPLSPGAVTDIGSIRDLIGQAARETGYGAAWRNGVPSELVAVELRVIADFGSEDLLVGAKRRLELVRRDGRNLLKLPTPYTKQIRSRRQRKQLMRMLEKIDP